MDVNGGRRTGGRSMSGPGPRDWDTQITAATDAAIDGDTTVLPTSKVKPMGSHRIRPVLERSPDTADWLPFTGRVGELAVDPADPSVLLVGIGPPGECTAELMLRAGERAGVRIPTRADVLVESVFPLGLPIDLDEAWTDGVVTGRGSRASGSLTVQVTADHHLGAARAVLAAQATGLARVLTNAPANVLTPAAAADRAADIAARAGLDCVVMNEADLAQAGCGAILAVGAGSTNPPRLVTLTYRGGDPVATVALTGKGITFDSGGLSLKSPAAMMPMRNDMAAAAAILAVMAVLPRLAPALTVHAVLPFAENMPGGGATKPGDVVRAANGTEIQVMDTDFEGRLVLADALVLAARTAPNLLVDLATLTYQVVIGLGAEIAGIIGRDADATERLMRAGAAAGEPWWPLPFDRRYADQMRTATGMRNHPMHDSGRAITAALFLDAFVPQHIPWVHGDIAGPAWTGDASSDGGTGFGVRTLLRLLADYPSATGVPSAQSNTSTTAAS